MRSVEEYKIISEREESGGDWDSEDEKPDRHTVELASLDFKGIRRPDVLLSNETSEAEQLNSQ